VYLRRREPTVVFGSVDSGVANSAGPDGLTFLDTVWDQAPFGSHAEFLATVERTADDWEGTGALTRMERTAIVDAARRAQADLQS
jgi:hypothetical protein